MNPLPPTAEGTPPRSQWPRLLLACPPKAVRDLAQTLAQQHSVQDVQLPQSGLALLKLQDSALGEAYYPGEVPIASAHVHVRSADGAVSAGAVQILDDRAGLARAIAIIDAVLAGQLPGYEAVQALFTVGSTRLDEQRAQRHALMAATRVDFSLIGSVDEEDAHD